MRLSSSVFAAVCLLIELLGIALFLRGFFPVPIKSSLSTKSKLSDLPAEPHAGSSQPNSTKVPSPLFKRVVIVLIDALREDFVFGPNGKRFMPYTRHIVERGSSHSFIAKARPPTVTMPRIKESEGSLPNLLVLCGDHGMSETGSHGGSSEPEVSTPLVLISPAFQRKDCSHPGVVEQVDLPPTLALALALPISQNSVGRLIPAMFEEASLREQLRFFHINGHQLSSLLRDSNPNFHKEDGYEQFRVAEKAHGNWMKLYMEGNASEVLGNMGKKVLKQYLEALQAMSAALSKQLGKYDIYSMIVGMILVLVLLLLAMPEALSGAACVDVPVAPAFLSLPFYLLSLLGSSVHVLVCTSAEASCYFCSLPWLLAFSAILFSSALLWLSSSLIMMLIQCSLSRFTNNHSSDWTLSELDVLLLTGTVGHTLSLGASSFVEEEHQTWYFLLNTLCLAVFQDVCRKYFRERRQSSDEEEEGPLLPSTVEEDPTRATFSPTAELGVSVGSEKWLALATPILTLACCRLLRSLNQTGVQWAHLDGQISVQKLHCSMVFRAELTVISIINWEARFVYVFVLGILFTGVKDLLRSQVMSSAVEGRRLKSRGLWEAYSGVVLLVALLVRAHNLPTLACCLLIQTLMAQFIWKKLHYDAAQTTIMHYWFGQAFFYFQGNSNNIATVDISVGFVGLESYVEAPAVFLTAFSTYAGPLLWACHLVCYLSSERDSPALSRACLAYCFALLRSIPAVFYVVLVTALRYHLFIWSVFSPKLLYESMHTLVTAAVCLFFTFMDQDRTRRP
uniref:Phosphatidylinositol glycan anchor biosynthesis class G n=1 Tax=Astyanax mexicanus TaxID=7994 RepID=A0A8B9L0I8_ASTMX